MNPALCLTLRIHHQGNQILSPSQKLTIQWDLGKEELDVSVSERWKAASASHPWNIPAHRTLPGSTLLPATSSLPPFAPFAFLLWKPSLTSATPASELLAYGTHYLKYFRRVYAALCTTGYAVFKRSLSQSDS